MKERFKIISAVHLFLLRSEEILLSRRFQTGYEDGKYSVPAGHLDGGETATAAMIREVREEIGIQLFEAHLRIVHVMHRASSEERIDWFFEATRWTGPVENREPQKCDDLRWFPLNNLPANMVPYVHSAIQHALAGKVYSEFGWEKNLSDFIALTVLPASNFVKT